MFQGIIPPIATPFNDDHSIDEAGYAQLLEYMIDGGVHTIIVGGTTGENYALTAEERIAQFHFAKRVINGRVPMLAGVNDMTTQGACAFAEAARGVGADGLLIAAPPYSLPTSEELAIHCRRIDQAAGLPIMLYNYPGRTGVIMDEEFLHLVSKHDNFKCIKEASGDINRIHILAEEFSDLELSCGAEDQALEFFVWGATSWVTPMGNFFIKEVVAFYETCVHKNDFIKARAMMAALLPLTSIIEGSGKFVQSVKYSMQFHGLPAGPVRPPMNELDEKFKEELNNVLQSAKTKLASIMSDQNS